MDEPVRLLIVDDHPLFRQGLVDVFETDPGMQVVAEAINGEVAIEQAREHHPEIVIMDVNLPNGNGLQVTRQILSEFPDTRVIILTGYDNSEQIFHSLKIGASAYCSKDIPPDSLLNTVYAVRQGHTVVHDRVMTDEEVQNWLLKKSGRYAGTSTETVGGYSASLSPREMEILGYVTRGTSNKDIALQLGISQQTVKNHMAAILRKLQVDDRTQAAIYALRHGWVRLEER